MSGNNVSSFSGLDSLTKAFVTANGTEVLKGFNALDDKAQRRVIFMLIFNTIRGCGLAFTVEVENDLLNVAERVDKIKRDGGGCPGCGGKK